ncbi:hypothetical protein AAHA92_25264 [Salvia divinorum]|uniref:Aspartic peptidase DDI1-type domain-containing protein n=1 Tax=Salvia divinorum TaxID=28513 RepID=A0ABD1GA25_SALDI
MDMLTRQLSQIAISINEMRGNDGKIPATVKMPGKENVSQITLRSGKAYEGATMRVENGEPSTREEGTDRLTKQTDLACDDYELRRDDLIEPLPQMADPFFLDQEPEVAIGERICEEKEQEGKKEDRGTSGDAPGSSEVKQEKPYPGWGETRKRKEDPIDFMEVFGKLEINLPFLQALKLPPFNRFIKDFIAGKAKADGKICIGESIFAVIQQKKLPSKRTDPGLFTLPIEIGEVRVEHAMFDLGASINVLPYSVYQRLVGARLMKTKVVIQLADRSCISPVGVLENVIVKVHDFQYPADSM